jgi:GntR family transcriptional regulator
MGGGRLVPAGLRLTPDSASGSSRGPENRMKREDDREAHGSPREVAMGLNRLRQDGRNILAGEMARTVDKTSRVPYYEQLRQILESDIRAGRTEVGDQLPSEAQLCDDYSVSRTVVRQALNELSNEGLIVRYKGKGSFVAPPKLDEHLVQSLTGLAEEVSARGGELTNEILSFERSPSPEQVAQVLALRPSEQVIHLERVRSINGDPWVVTSSYLPASLCADLLEFDMRSRSLYATLEHELGLHLDHGHRTIEAALASDRHASLLEIPIGAPVLLLKSVAFMENDQPVEYFHAWHRGDRTRFDVNLTRDTDVPSGVGELRVGSTSDLL